jgi:uncharacterized membrane protein
MHREGSDATPPPFRWPRLTAGIVALSLLAVVLLLVIPPRPALDKADLVGYAVCHRIPERSFFVDGRQLPLCARCSGTFLGTTLGLVAMILRRRRRAAGFPPLPVLILLALFAAVWAVDGLNSYLTLFPSAPHLYEPMNWLRLTTGMLNGLALIHLLMPLFTLTVWQDATSERVIKNPMEVIAILPAAGLLVALVLSGVPYLLYPLALTSSLGVVILLSLTNAVIAAVILRREGQARSWRQAFVPLSVGTALGLLEIAGLVLLRNYLATLGITIG